MAWFVVLACAACGAEQDDGSDGTTMPWLTTATAGSEADADSSAGDDNDDDDDTSPSDDTGMPDETTGVDATDDSGGSDPGTSSGAETGQGNDLDPPAGGSSGGAGGGAAGGELRMTADGIQYRIIAPGDAGPLPLMIVFSGTEGGAAMTSNLGMLGGFTGTDGFVFAVLDGVQYNGNGDAGASVLDEVRADYDIDNDRTYLLGESAGTTASLELGLALRQSYFAAYWANDVNASLAPTLDAAALGFAPFGNAGPGGQFASADAIVNGMEAAGYRTPEPSPYDGPGAGTHGDVDQFIAALQWFPGKTRQ